VFQNDKLIFFSVKDIERYAKRFGFEVETEKDKVLIFYDDSDNIDEFKKFFKKQLKKNLAFLYNELPIKIEFKKKQKTIFLNENCFKDLCYLPGEDDYSKLKFNKIIVFTSSLYQVEKVMYLLKYAKDLNELGKKCLIIDADKEAQLLSFVSHVNSSASFLDIIETINENNFDCKLICESIKKSKHGNNYFIPYTRYSEQFFDPRDTFWKLLKENFDLNDLFDKLRNELKIDYVLINASNAISDWAAPFVLDKRFTKIVVSSKANENFYWSYHQLESYMSREFSKYASVDSYFAVKEDFEKEISNLKTFFEGEKHEI